MPKLEDKLAEEYGSSHESEYSEAFMGAAEDALQAVKAGDKEAFAEALKLAIEECLDAREDSGTSKGKGALVIGLR